MAKFIVKKGAKPGQEIPFESTRVVFGRSDDCDVVIADVNVSRRHAQAVVIDGLTAMMDLNSSNGTYVNELPISRIFLMDGDEVRLGETVLVFFDNGGSREHVGAPVAAHPRLKTPMPETPAKKAGGKAVPSLDHTQLFGTIADDLRTDALKDVYQKLKALYRVFHEVAQASTIKEIFEAVGRTLVMSIDAERVVFFMNAERSGEEWQRFHQHLSTKLPDKAARKVESQDVLDRVRAEQRMIQTHVDKAGKAHFSDKEANTLAVPLFRGETVAAAIYIDSPVSQKPLTKDDVDFVMTLSLQVNIAFNQVGEVQQLKQENVQLRQKLDADFVIIANNEKMKEIMEISARVAEADSTVLIAGESGTGKELIARSLHHFSRRSSKPMVAVNCAALPETLLESELFGHEKGAFTGALERRIGKFELADGGTLFLDEIGDISAAAQAKLLRVLQEGEIQRVGGNKVIKVDVRVIVATNKHLKQEVEKGNFRDDLYFRIRVIELNLPPLRERPDDIPVLSEYFLKQLRQRIPTTVKSISPEAMEALVKYPWPGNVRELRNVIERGLVFARGNAILREHLPVEVLQDSQRPASKLPKAEGRDTKAEHLPLAELERRHIVKVLKQAKGNKQRAANVLGINRTTLYEKIKAYDISDEVESELDAEETVKM